MKRYFLVNDKATGESYQCSPVFAVDTMGMVTGISLLKETTSLVPAGWGTSWLTRGQWRLTMISCILQ